MISAVTSMSFRFCRLYSLPENGKKKKKPRGKITKNSIWANSEISFSFNHSHGFCGRDWTGRLRTKISFMNP